jgi:hypothetical protein
MFFHDCGFWVYGKGCLGGQPFILKQINNFSSDA